MWQIKRNKFCWSTFGFNFIELCWMLLSPNSNCLSSKNWNCCRCRCRDRYRSSVNHQVNRDVENANRSYWNRTILELKMNESHCFCYHVLKQQCYLFMYVDCLLFCLSERLLLLNFLRSSSFAWIDRQQTFTILRF